MKKPRTLFYLLFIGLWGWTTDPAFAQNNTQASPLHNIMRGKQDLLDQTLKNIDEQKKEGLANDSGIPFTINEILDNLKNPFLPQTPQIIEEPPPQQQEAAPAKVIDEPQVFTRKAEVNVPERKKTPPPQLKISGLIWNSNLPQAILDNKIVEIGDTIKDCKVLNITKDGVELLFEETTFSVKP